MRSGLGHARTKERAALRCWRYSANSCWRVGAAVMVRVATVAQIRHVEATRARDHAHRGRTAPAAQCGAPADDPAAAYVAPLTQTRCSPSSATRTRRAPTSSSTRTALSASLSKRVRAPTPQPGLPRPQPPPRARAVGHHPNRTHIHGRRLPGTDLRRVDPARRRGDGEWFARVLPQRAHRQDSVRVHA